MVDSGGCLGIWLALTVLERAPSMLRMLFEISGAYWFRFGLMNQSLHAVDVSLAT